MANKQVVLDEVMRWPDGICDSCLELKTKISPHQQVNAKCRELAADGAIARDEDKTGKCGVCKKENILNRPFEAEHGELQR
jgi:hypothetical protein